MERIIKLRTVMRGRFTRNYNALQKHLMDNNIKEVKAIFIILGDKWKKLKEYDEEILQIMVNNNELTEEDYEKEEEVINEYETKYNITKLDIESLDIPTGNRLGSANNYDDDDRNSVSTAYCKNLKLPAIKLDTFDGNLKGWLPFWGQFEIIHNDDSIPTFHKFRVLSQSLKEGSRAKQVVDSFPISKEFDNYNAAVEALKERFGREDLLIEVYIRELLEMIVQNSKSYQFSLDDLYDRLECQLRFLEILGVTTGKSAAILCPLLESCMSEDFLRVWQRSYISDEVKDAEKRLGKFREFIKAEVQNEQRISLAMTKFGIPESSDKSNRTNSSVKPFKKVQQKELPSALGLLTTHEHRQACIFCSQSHNSTDCFKARDMTNEDKLKYVRDSKSCYLCLKRYHSSKQCKVKSSCPLCDRRHALIICPNFSRNKYMTGNVQTVTGKYEQKAAEKGPIHETATHTSLTCDSSVILPTIKLYLKGPYGESRTIRAVFDTAAQRSYVLNSTAREMNLKTNGEETLHHTLFGGKRLDKTVHDIFEVSLYNLDDDRNYTIEALGQDVICGDLPTVPNGPWIDEMIKCGINTSNVLSECGPIELLIGADFVASLFTGNIKKFEKCNLVGIETLFGWIISGKSPKIHNKPHTAGMLTTNMLVNSMKEDDLWRLDLIGIDDPTEQVTKDQLNKEVQQYFLDTISVNDEGRYEIHLPWKQEHSELPNNFELARKRLITTYKKLQDDGYLNEYQNVFNEWISEGVIEELPATDNKYEGHYLPHKHVVKLNSSTKVRPVYDASANEKGSPSLNDCLQKGCNLIEQIPPLIHKFRMNKIGVVADIRRAFLQISVNPKDRMFLKFLWYNSDGRLIVYQHKRVVFGLTSSPFLLAAVLKYHLQNAKDKMDPGKSICSSSTIDKLLNCFYVDNVVVSFDSQEEVHAFMTEATAVMADGMFDLRAWECTADGSANAITPVLGLSWDRGEDTIKISTENLNLPMDRVTKRTIMSAAHRVFDPIGIVSPVTVCPKLLIKELWTLKLDWDDEVPPAIMTKFLKWMHELRLLKDVAVPRWIFGMESVQKVSIHTFTDASENSYAAVIFLRVESATDVKVQLIQSKTRVSPVKLVTIPRLELLAATIGARLFSSVRDYFPSSSEEYFWTDSTTVLAWLNRSDHWASFVFNRVTEIRKFTNVDKWHHVPGVVNPADLPSRGCLGKQLVESRWWEGPEWLCLSPDKWPSSKLEYNEELISNEKRKRTITSMVVTKETQAVAWYCKYFSQYTKLVRMFAWIFRFIDNCKVSNTECVLKKSGHLSIDEFKNAEENLLKLVQRESFKGVNDPSIVSLQPFEDYKGLIRLRTKVSNRPDSMDFRFPILLPKGHPVVNRLIHNFHVQNCHVGVSGLLSITRERFWIIGGRRTIKSAVSSCTVCKRYDSKRIETPAIPLPVDRVREASAFEVVGIDLAGPIYLKNGQKAWICLFTCAVVRAIHLELLQSLSTEDFLMGLRRFIARRGRPVRVYSDQGTNFIGAVNLLEKINWDNVLEYCDVNRISWRFNPPTAAWWGGWWERLIGLTKRVLRKVIKKSTLSYTEMETILCDCESVLNSRPLTYISDSEVEATPITPSQFIQDIRESGMPELDVIESVDLKKKWQHKAKLKEDFRNRFRSEYLGLLQSRFKSIKSHSIKVGDVVLIGSDNTKRLDWPLGKVIELFPGNDGKTRLVRLKTASGNLMRPVKRLYYLLEGFENQLELTPNEEKNKSEIITSRGRIIKKPKRF